MQANSSTWREPVQRSTDGSTTLDARSITNSVTTTTVTLSGLDTSNKYYQYAAYSLVALLLESSHQVALAVHINLTRHLERRETYY